MRKSLLLISALTLVSSAFALPVEKKGLIAADRQPERVAEVNGAPQKAESEELFIQYGYAGDVANAYALGGESSSSYIFMAFQIPVADQQKYIGSKITSLTITSGSSVDKTNRVRNINVFVTDDISNGIKDMTSGRLRLPEYSNTTIDLDTPYEITGEKTIYVGYAFKYPGSGTYYIPVDEEVTDLPSCLVAKTSSLTAKPAFKNYADQIGSLCMSCKLVGDNLPTNIADVMSLNVPEYVKYENGKISYSLTVKNTGANSINSMEIATDISNGSSSVQTVNLDSPLTPGAKGQVEIKDAANNSAGVYVLSSKVVKVNGVDVQNPVVSSSTMASYNDGFKRYPVIEEVTGAGCGFCPRGIVSMDCIGENFPDWIRIGIHCTWFGPDQMTIQGYSSMINKYFSSNPEAITNRMRYTELYGDYPEEYAPIYNYYTSFPAYGDIELKGYVSENLKRIKIASTTKFSVPSDVEHLLSFVIVQDGVGPYDQHNYFSGGGYGAMSGWEKESEYVSTYYNEVARAINKYPGIAGSLPAVIEANTEYAYETEMSLSTVTGDNFRVIGLITNAVTGEIINAKEISMPKVGVDNIADETHNISISVVDGNVVVNGAENVNVYTLDGSAVGTTGLAKGVYIVTADGVSRKVLVK